MQNKVISDSVDWSALIEQLRYMYSNTTDHRLKTKIRKEIDCIKGYTKGDAK